LFNLSEIKKYVATIVPKQRIESYFILGLSISKVLEQNSIINIVRSFSQLIEEWEYHYSGTTMQSVKFVMAKNSPCLYPESVQQGVEELSRPSIYKFNNVVVYEYLEVPHLPFELDYIEVLLALLDSLSMLYDKLLHVDSYRFLFIQIIYKL
jgi:hypothetical protein